MIIGFFGIISYISELSSFPKPLAAKEERECLLKWWSGDIEARNKLIEHNLRLVAYLVKKFSNTNHNQDDLISIGTIGLIKAISTYKDDKNTKLATYASRCIENAILSFRIVMWGSAPHPAKG